MKKLLIPLLCFLLVGCHSNKDSVADFTEKEIFPVVERYLENSAAGNWKEVYQTLSGEALAEAKANAARVKSVEKIIAKRLQLTQICKDVAGVSADFIKTSNGGFDRLAYNFRLVKQEGGWLIYKTTYRDYIHGDLKPGPLPPEAFTAIKTYIELPFSHKRKDNHKYLAGKLLQESQKAALLPVDSKTSKDQENIKTVVKTMDCLGFTDGYAVVRVGYDVIKENTAYQMEMLVDVLDVNGTWKICGINVTKA